MKNFLPRTLLLSACFTCALFTTSYSADNPMAPFAVKEARREHFVVTSTSGIPGMEGRLWFQSCERGQLAQQFAKKQPYISRYFCPDIKQGDEIIRIDGQSVADMATGEARHIMDIMAKRKSPIITLEVQAEGSKEVRKITVTGVPYAVITIDADSTLPATAKAP